MTHLMLVTQQHQMSYCARVSLDCSSFQRQTNGCMSARSQPLSAEAMTSFTAVAAEAVAYADRSCVRSVFDKY